MRDTEQAELKAAIERARADVAADLDAIAERSRLLAKRVGVAATIGVGAIGGAAILLVVVRWLRSVIRSRARRERRGPAGAARRVEAAVRRGVTRR